jgi:hypothetical protein
MAYYRMSVGECVNQVYKVDAKSWEEAKNVAFADMREGDVLAECPPEAVKQYDDYSEYHYIDENLCTEYATLHRGTWANTPSGREYWEESAWYFDDAPETFLNGKGEEFTDWADS